MKYRVTILPSARGEITEALLWQIEHRPASAAAWYTGMQGAILSLCEWPLRYALAPEADVFPVEVRQHLYGKGQGVYRILYTVRDKTVYILHVRHAARAPVTEDEASLPP